MRKPWKKPEVLPVYVAPSAAGDLVAFGDTTALELLGGSGELIPKPFVRAVQAATAMSGDIAAITQSATGAVLHLTDESKQMLAKYDQIESGGALLGVLKGPDGKIIHQLKFVQPGAAVAASLPGLMSGVAVQQQMASIEKKLNQIQAGIDYLTKVDHIETEAEVAAALDIVSTTYDDVIQHSEFTNDQWMRIANVELPIRTLHERTVRHLQSLEDALIDLDVPMRERAKRLEGALRDEHADVWLGLHVQADRALTQWESLTLLRQIDNHPERAAALVETMTAYIQARHETMLDLARSISRYLIVNGREPGFLERIQFLTLRRHKRLLDQLDSILFTYRTAAEELSLPLDDEDPLLPVGGEIPVLASLTATLSRPGRALVGVGRSVVEVTTALPSRLTRKPVADDDGALEAGADIELD